jgi:acyl-coenzyme A synthetase/AMP-(fatty) acid ligase
MWDIFCALTSGAELHLVPSVGNLLPNVMADFTRNSRLTQWASVPAVLIAMANRGGICHGDFPDLRRLMWYGEALPTQFVKFWMERLPHAEFTNFYGPTEVTLISTYYTVPSIPEENGPPIPIGKPVPGRKLVILNNNDEPVSVDTVGQLCIGGKGLTPGYWRRPEKTAAAFFESPPNSGEWWYRTGDLVRMDAAGLCHFHGRTDRQIKLRGYRIELDEIELALGRLAGISESGVVAVTTNRFRGTQICAAYVQDSEHVRTPEELRNELAMALPAYMLPLNWLKLPSLPRNRNDKIDYLKLKELFIHEA